MAYLVLDLTLIALTGPSQNCYNELALLHNNSFITYSEPLSEWGALFSTHVKPNISRPCDEQR